MGDIVTPASEGESDGERLPQTVIQSIANVPQFSLSWAGAAQLRQTALQHAVDLARVRLGYTSTATNTGEILAEAKKFEVYLLGDLANTNGDSDDDD